MMHSVPREFVDAFYRVLESRDPVAIGNYLHDDVIWTIGGPVDLLPFCGEHRGKDAVVALLSADLSAILSQRRFITSAVLIEGERIATLGRITAHKRSAGHAISYRVAQFIRFEDGRVREYTAIIDSYDAVEQVLGRPLGYMSDHRTVDLDDVIAV